MMIDGDKLRGDSVVVELSKPWQIVEEPCLYLYTVQEKGMKLT